MSKAQTLVDVKVPMRDGVALSADIFLPPQAAPAPTVLMRTPYGNNTDLMIEKGRKLASRGYAAVIQDVRGRWDSDGSYYPVKNEADDGHDTVEWVAEQPWSTGKIGMAGGSYLGITQWTAAWRGTPHLTSIVPRVAPCDFYDSPGYTQGALQIGVLATWGSRTHGRTAQNIEYEDWGRVFRTLPVDKIPDAIGRDLDFWKDWVRHPHYDEYWEQFSNSGKWQHMNAPAYNMGGWFDLYSKATFDNWNELRLHGGSPEARQSQLIMGPWPHALSLSRVTGEVDFGADSVVDLDAEELRWFDYWLKGEQNGILDEPPLRLFIMGRNEWRSEHEWPLARTDWQPWFFHSRGAANTLNGDGGLSIDSPTDEPTDNYAYDPMAPVPTLGGNNCCSPHIVPWGPYDQQNIEMRQDVLCYTSEPLQSELEVTGPIKVALYAATDQQDTDWTAKLVDVHPDGRALSLCDGIVRARFREGRESSSLIQPGKVYEYEIDLWVIGNVFKAGHCIRVEVSSSNFPRFDRNLNTGAENNALEDQWQVARQAVHHSRAYPSQIMLPVIPSA